MAFKSRWKGWAYIGFFLVLWVLIAIALPGYSEMTKQQRGGIGLVATVICLAGVIRGILYLRKKPS